MFVFFNSIFLFDRRLPVLDLIIVCCLSTPFSVNMYKFGEICLTYGEIDFLCSKVYLSMNWLIVKSVNKYLCSLHLDSM